MVLVFLKACPCNQKSKIDQQNFNRKEVVCFCFVVLVFSIIIIIIVLKSGWEESKLVILCLMSLETWRNLCLVLRSLAGWAVEELQKKWEAESPPPCFFSSGN